MTKRREPNPFLEELFSEKPVNQETEKLFDEVFIMLGTHAREKRRKLKETKFKRYQKRKPAKR